MGSHFPFRKGPRGFSVLLLVSNMKTAVKTETKAWNMSKIVLPEEVKF